MTNKTELWKRRTGTGGYRLGDTEARLWPHTVGERPEDTPTVCRKCNYNVCGCGQRIVRVDGKLVVEWFVESALAPRPGSSPECAIQHLDRRSVRGETSWLGSGAVGWCVRPGELVRYYGEARIADVSATGHECRRYVRSELEAYGRVVAVNARHGAVQVEFSWNEPYETGYQQWLDWAGRMCPICLRL